MNNQQYEQFKQDVETVKETTQLLLPDGVTVSASITATGSLMATFIISVGDMFIHSFGVTPQTL